MLLRFLRRHKLKSLKVMPRLQLMHLLLTMIQNRTVQGKSEKAKCLKAEAKNCEGFRHGCEAGLEQTKMNSVRLTHSWEAHNE